MSELPLKEAIKILTQEKKKVELKLAKAYDSFCLYPNERDQNDWDRFSALDSAFEMAISALQAQDGPDKNVGDMISRRFVELLAEYHDPELCTYKEYKGKPYFSIKYIENGEGYIGYGTYSPKVLSRYLREYFTVPAQPERRWIPCSERLPEEHIGFYLVTVQKRRITALNVVGCDNTVHDIVIARWDYDRRVPQRGYHWCKEDKVIAWMPLPEPYKEGDSDDQH